MCGCACVSFTCKSHGKEWQLVVSAVEVTAGSGGNDTGAGAAVAINGPDRFPNLKKIMINYCMCSSWSEFKYALYCWKSE